MIDIASFHDFLFDLFYHYEIVVDHFKDDVKFFDIDCFPDECYKLTIACSTEDIRIGTINKTPQLDFSLHDFVFTDNDEVRSFLENIKMNGKYPKS